MGEAFEAVSYVLSKHTQFLFKVRLFVLCGLFFFLPNLPRIKSLG